MSSRWFLVKREGKIEGPFEEGFLITMAKQGRLLPTDELAENQDGPWEIAKTHPVVIAAKPKKRNTLQINDYKVLTRKASEDKYEIRYWCTKCSTTIIVEEEEALRDYRCPACGIPSTIVDEAFTEITADREERQRRATEREQKTIEKERVKEERLIAREDRLKRRKESVTKLASATTSAAKNTAKTASSVVSSAAMATKVVANTATTLAKDALEEAAKPENIASRKKAMAEGVGYVKEKIKTGVGYVKEKIKTGVGYVKEKIKTAKHSAKKLADSEVSKNFRQKLWAVFLAATKAGQPRKHRVVDAAAIIKEEQMRRLERSQQSWESWGQGIGTIALIIGIVITAFSYFADTTVDTTLGRFNNFGLMNEQRNGMLLGLGLSAVGVVLLTAYYSTMARSGMKFDRRLDRLCPKCGEPIKKVATLCRHCNSDIEKEIDL